jgi:predicted acylesterase/phospholipase RssA
MFHEGSLCFHALTGAPSGGVRASCSLPGVFPPILAENAVHIDGGLVNNLPTDIIRIYIGVGFVLAVDVGAGPATGNHGNKGDAVALPNILELLTRIVTMSDDARGLGSPAAM